MGRSRLHTGMFWRSRGAQTASARRAKGSAGAGCGVLRDCPQHTQIRGGALRGAAPPGAGEEDGSREVGANQEE